MNQEMTTGQATDEAVLRFTRRMRRLFPKQFNQVWDSMPGPAREALLKADVRATVLRDGFPATAEGLTGMDWPQDEEITEQ